ncbi:MAG: hypothetical protein VX589_03225 [Myxococcota bacterium]|nr:hypothetical protein [Myxococcota bacterium]
MALPEDRRIPADKFPEQARRFVAADAPQRLKSAVASGMIPLKPLVQVCALYQIDLDSESALRATVKETLRKMPPATMQQIVKQPLLPVVLDWLSRMFNHDAALLKLILLNRQTDDDTVLAIAQTADEAMCDIIAQNQTRLLGCPALVEALYFNRAARASTVDRILDFSARNGLKLPNIPDYEQLVAEITGKLPTDEASETAQDEAFRQAQTALEELSNRRPESATTNDRASRSTSKDEDFFGESQDEEVETRSKSAAGRIRELNVAQRVRLAMMGTASDRAILIQDTNKIVARNVIRSPAVTDSEVLHYSKNKSLLDEVIAYIAHNRKWTRNYRIKMNLVMNPKTPVTDAMHFLTHLRTNDLQLVSRSKDVPGPIAKAAKNMIKVRRR